MSTVALERFTPYSTAVAFSATPAWIPGLDAERIVAYQLYEQIWDSVQGTFAAITRGTEDEPIYLPTPKTIINTKNRYLAPGFGFAVDGGEDGDAMAAILSEALTTLFKRERFYSKFAANKRYGLIRGDWCFHVLGNPMKEQGSRLSIQTLDPASYFPVPHPADPDRIIAAHIIEQIELVPGSEEYYIKRQTYYRGADPVANDGSDLTIYNEIAIFDMENWFDLTAKRIQILKPIEALPSQITTIPIYHIKNNEAPGNPYGQSEMKSYERVLGALNQGISDEELTLAYQGLGMYATDGGAPVDAEGNPTNWVLGPGQVVEHANGSSFKRVEGVGSGSIKGMLDHLNFIKNEIKESHGLADVAVGKADSSVAESGIALIIQLGPILAWAGENQNSITDVMSNMFWDLKAWLDAYETINTGLAFAVPTYGNPVPENKQQSFDNIIKLVETKIVSVEWAQKKLAELGYEIEPGDLAKIVSESASFAAATDPFAERAAGELAEADAIEA